jgi:fatty acid synthase subunit beta
LLSNDSLKLVPRRLATRTLKAKYEAQDDSITHSRVILCHAKHGKEIYYQFEDELVIAEAESLPEATTAGASTAIPMASVPVASPAPSGPAASIEDVPMRASDVLNVIVTQKLKKVEEVPPSKSRTLSEGSRLFRMRYWAIFR